MRTDLTITTAIAAALMASGCSRQQREPDGWTAQTDTAICTDREGRRVADDQCPRQALASGTHGSGASSTFLWYFLARNAVIPPYGERARGGSFARTSGASYARAPGNTFVTRAGAVSRGGFGASAHSYGSGRA
jgi:hypothetical protein